MDDISATIYTISDEALNAICLAQIISQADCYKIYQWANAELRRLQDQAVAAGRPMTDAEVMFPDAWKNNTRIFETFLAAFQEHLRASEQTRCTPNTADRDNQCKEQLS